MGLEMFSGNTEQKRCPKCGEAKPPSEFYRNKNAVDGRDGWCKACRNTYHKKRAARSSDEIAVAAPSHKTCTTCREQKSIAEFYRDQRQTDGRETRCKECKNQERRERNWKQHPERMPAPEGMRRCHICGEAKPLDAFWWKWKSRGHRSQICETCTKAKYQEHPEKGRAKQHRRNARKSALVADLTERDWEQTLAVFDNRCAYCGGLPSKGERGRSGGVLHQEHVMAVNNGGGYTLGNIVPSCRLCNTSKNTKPYREWMQSKGYDIALFEHKLSNLEWLVAE